MVEWVRIARHWPSQLVRTPPSHGRMGTYSTTLAFSACEDQLHMVEWVRIARHWPSQLVRTPPSHGRMGTYSTTLAFSVVWSAVAESIHSMQNTVLNNADLSVFYTILIIQQNAICLTAHFFWGVTQLHVESRYNACLFLIKLKYIRLPVFLQVLYPTPLLQIGKLYHDYYTKHSVQLCVYIGLLNSVYVTGIPQYLGASVRTMVRTMVRPYGDTVLIYRRQALTKYATNDRTVSIK